MSSSSQPSDGPPSPDGRRRWSFSIWGLMQIVLAAAVAVATGKTAVLEMLRTIDSYREVLSFRKPTFYDWLINQVFSGMASALLAPVAAIMSLSLVFQAVHLLIAGRHCRFRSAGERCDWVFQWAGRLGLAATILGCVLIEHVFSIEQLGLTVTQDFMWPQSAKALRAAVLIVAIMACLGWTMRLREPSTQRRRGQWLVQALFFPAAAALAMLLWMESSTVHRLVYIAVLGIESSEPLKFADPTVALLPMDRVAVFYRYALLAAAGTFASAVCCGVLIRWPLAWRWTLPLAAAMLGGWSIQAAFLHWVYWDGIRSLTPAWPEQIGLSHPHVAWTALCLNGLLATVVAYYFSRHASADPYSWTILSRETYFHESRLALGLLTIGAAGHLIPYVWQLSLDAEGCLWLALFIFCATRLRRSRRAADAELTCNAWCLPPGRFFANVITLAMTFALAAPTIGLFSFIFWLGPVNWLRVFERV